MTKFRLSFLVLFVTLALAWPMAAKEQRAIADPELRIENGLLTVNIVNIPLVTIMRRISGLAGFKLAISGELDEPISTTFARVPIARALMRLVGRHGIAIAYRMSLDGSRTPLPAIVSVIAKSAGDTDGVKIHLPPPLPKILSRSGISERELTARMQRLGELQNINNLAAQRLKDYINSSQEDATTGSMSGPAASGAQ